MVRAPMESTIGAPHHPRIWLWRDGRRELVVFTPPPSALQRREPPPTFEAMKPVVALLSTTAISATVILACGSQPSANAPAASSAAPAPAPPPPPSPGPAAGSIPGPPPPAELMPDGMKGCANMAQCASAICEGLGCTDDAFGTCVAHDRKCTRDLVTYCACDGTTFQASGSCPGKRYAHRGACTK